MFLRITEEIWSGRRGSNSQLSAWEAGCVATCFQQLTELLRRIDLAILAGLAGLACFAASGGTMVGQNPHHLPPHRYSQRSKPLDQMKQSEQLF